jgi:hypothetical protein
MEAQNKFKVIVAGVVLFFVVVVTSAYVFMSKSNKSTQETIVKKNKSVNEAEKKEIVSKKASDVSTDTATFSSNNLNANLVTNLNDSNASSSQTLNTNNANNASYDMPYGSVNNIPSNASSATAVANASNNNNNANSNNMNVAQNLPGQDIASLNAALQNRHNLQQQQQQQSNANQNYTNAPQVTTNTYDYLAANANANANAKNDLNARINKLEQELYALKKQKSNVNLAEVSHQKISKDKAIQDSNHKNIVANKNTKVLAVIGDRAWVEDKSGNEYTLSIPEKDMQNEKDVIIRSSSN